MRSPPKSKKGNRPMSDTARFRRATLLMPAVLILAACSPGASPSTAAQPSPGASPSTAASASSAALPSAPSSGEASTASGSGTPVSATETEFKIALGASSATAGPVTFQINNAGTVVHEFVVMKTDLAADKLPIDTSKGVVSEETSGLTVIDEVEDIAIGATPSLAVTLPAGHYVLICNLPGHYAGGMHAEFTTN